MSRVTDDLEQRLTDAANAAREHEVTAARVAELRELIAQGRTELADLGLRADQEDRDVAALESMSFSRVLASLRGSRDDALARERAEAEAARYRIAEASTRLDVLRREFDTVWAREKVLGGAAAAYAAALAEKDRRLQSSADPRAQRLLELAERRGRLAAEAERAQQALQAATRAASSLERLVEVLGEARLLSAFDTFLGGGAFATAMKHDAIDDAAAAAASVDASLQALQRTIGHVAGAVLPTNRLRLDGLTRFTDMWLDNIIVDLEVRDRVKEMRANAERVTAIVAELRAQLEEQAARSTADLAGAEAERRTLLAT